MVLDLVIKDGFVVSPDSMSRMSIGIDGGKIVEIGKSSYMNTAEEVIDAEEKYVIPGCIDVHVHFREPLRDDKEDWLTGSMGAACGGVTTVLDMPESMESTVESLKEKISRAEKKSIVDFGLYGRPTCEENVSDFFRVGVIAYKILLGYEQFVPDDGTFFQILRSIRETNLPAVVHAEDIVIVKTLQEQLLKEGKMDIEAHEESRPPFIEEEAIAKSLILAREAACKLHLAHASTSVGTGLIKLAKELGQNVTAETCPHYLVLKQSHLDKLGPYGKINPPVRGTEEEIEGLWTGILNGAIDCIATDHAPHLVEEKEVGWNNIFEASPGAVGVQTMLPLMLTEVNKGRLSLKKLVEVSSANPAKIFNIFPNKGAIKIGSDADLVVINLKKKSVIKVREQHSKMPFTPYDGWEVQGIPETTIIRGRIVAHKGEITTKPGTGKWIKPINAPAQL